MSDDHSNAPFMRDAHVIPEPAAAPTPTPAPIRVPGQKEHERLFPGQPCFYCGDSAQSVDHKIPRSKGGQRGQNLVPACLLCNQMKANLTVEEFVAQMKRILRMLGEKKVIQFGEELKWPVAA